jgi:hypothetical protein
MKRVIADKTHDEQKDLVFTTLPTIPTLDPGDFGFLRPLKPTRVFSSYWRFAAERQQVFLRRIHGAKPPWSDDPILQIHKFTNAYRASDRVSQYLLREVIYDGEYDLRDTFFRILLFKIFNRIDTWELLESEFGKISLETYSFNRYDRVLSEAMAKGERLYSAAYIMPSGGRSSEYARKHQMHLRLLERMIADELPEQMSEATSMARGFELLRGYPSIGDFLAYQYVTDLNYSQLTTFGEMEFVIPGPGARDGIKKCFADYGGLTEAEIIKFIAKRQDECFSAVGVQFPTLWGRSLQLIDCQNLFCEVDKYSRVAHPEISGLSGRTRIKQKLKPSSDIIKLFYPPKWGINHKLNEEPEYVPNTRSHNSK